MTLKNKLYRDLNLIGVPTDFKLSLRGSSTTYNGRYVTSKSLVVIYDVDEVSYEEIVKRAIHEATHHYQWKHSPTFIRFKGIMHDKNFKRKESEFLRKAYELGLISKDYEEDNKYYMELYSFVSL